MEFCKFLIVKYSNLHQKSYDDDTDNHQPQPPSLHHITAHIKMLNDDNTTHGMVEFGDSIVVEKQNK